ncbi:MAG: TlyA family RNA methyltransferase [Pseudothermotoga sp.]
MKERLDILLVQKGLATSRSQARDLIRLKRVTVGGQICEKPGKIIDSDSEIQLQKPRTYVSRAAEKLEKAYQVFHIDFFDKVVCDIGASRGGFTQFAIEHGARRVYAVDVGSNQLAEQLRMNPKVVCLERFNARYLSADKIGELVDLVLCDVSFISVKLLLEGMSSVLKEEGKAVILIKPQFETGPSLVQSKSSHLSVIIQIIRDCSEHGLSWHGLTYSPITGSDGNIEYLAYFVKESSKSDIIDIQGISRIVNEAWSRFRGEE